MEEFIEGFLKLYRQRTCLWKVKAPEYSNKWLKNNAYEELVIYCQEQLADTTIDIYWVKNEIKTLRNTFRKEYKKVEASKRTGQERIYEPTLWYYDLLLFTKDQDDLTVGIDSIKEEECILVFETPTPTPSRPPPPIRPPPQKRKANDNPPEIKKCNYTYATTSTEKDGVDEYMAIGINIAAKLKKMSPEQAHLSESLINQVITKGLFDELTRRTIIMEKSTANPPDGNKSAFSAESISSELSSFQQLTPKLFDN